MTLVTSLLSSPSTKQDPCQHQHDSWSLSGSRRILAEDVDKDNLNGGDDNVWMMASLNFSSDVSSSSDNDVISEVCASNEWCTSCGRWQYSEDSKTIQTGDVSDDEVTLCEKCGLINNIADKSPSEFSIRCQDCGNCGATSFENYFDCDDNCVCDTVVCLSCQKTIFLPVALQWCETDVEHCAITPESNPRLDKIVPVHSRTRVRTLEMLRPGDHIAWHRDYIIWHHAIVENVDAATGVLTIISYNGHPVKLNGHFASVRKEDEIIDVTTDELYRYNYDKADFCYTPLEVIARAESRLGEHNYNPWTSNCEHFARWCKAGHERSYQVDVFRDRMGKLAGSVITKVSEEGAVAATRGLIEGATVEEIFTVGFKSAEGIADRLMEYIPGGPTVARGLKWGAIACNMFVNFSIEAANFGIDTWWAYKNYQNGKISRDDFHQGMAKVGCESAGGFLGATCGGFLGQLLIPVPFLGGFLGCTLGNLFGRFVGAVVGKKIRN